MTSTKRALTALATGALALPFIYAPAAYAQTPTPTRQSIAPFCENVPEDFDQFDDIDSLPEQFQEAINCIAFADVTRGRTSVSQYDPEINVNRDAMASFIARLVDTADELEAEDGEGVNGLPADDGVPQFTDTRGNFHEENIERLADARIVFGGPGELPATRYGPAGNVTRAQMASFIVRALEFITDRNLATSGDFFTDDEGDVHEENINALAAIGIVDGVAPGRYNPSGSVDRDNMALFLARALGFLAEEGFIDAAPAEEPPPGEEPPPAEQDEATVTAGAVENGQFTLTVAGADVDSVTVTGACIDEQTFTANPDDADDSQTFTVVLADDAAAGSCVITVVTSFTEESGFEDETDTVTITVPEGPVNAAASVRPELIDAEITDTNTGTETGTDGTTVRFTFDEEVTGTTAPVANLFHVFSQDGRQFDGSNSVVIESGGNSVLVTFTDVTTDADAADLTVATVDFGAVTDDEGDENPIGDAPLGTDSDNTTGFTAGETEAPDLELVQNFRTGPVVDGTPTTLVDFVFDENAFVVNEAGFSLVLTNGEVIGCVATDNTATTDLTDSTGDGTDTITVACEQTAATGPITADEVARGIVQEDTVSDANEDPTVDATPNADPFLGNTNPLQASDTPDASTPDPDLVSAELRFDQNLSGTPGDDGDDQVVFTFDEAVVVEADDDVRTADTLDAADDFFAFDVNGDQVTATSVERGTNANQIIATFADGALDDAVGASVDEDAVEGQTGTASRNNEDDEVGVANTNTNPDVQTAGRTDNPDLIEVRVEDNADGEAEVVFVFDEDVQVVDKNGEFFLIQADGTRLVCVDDNAEAGNVGTVLQPDFDNTVRCTDFAVIDETDDTTNQADIATSAQVREAVVGTVDDDAVIGEDDDAANVIDGGAEDDDFAFGNPEGAELLEGSTGTPSE